MQLVLRVFFRKVYFSGAHLLAADKPLILACNHPNSFMDAVLLAVLLPRPLHFLARSDVFNSPVKRWLLSRLHLIPIYRLEEGAENLHRNQETFTRCYDILQKKGAILIFSEGVCVLEKRLRPLRKGTARLAFGAEASCQFELGLQVVPIGINYTYPARFRQEVMIGVGTPVSVQELAPVYTASPARAISQLNQSLVRELEDNVIVIADPGQEALVEERLVASRAACPDFLSGGWLSASRHRLQTERALAREAALPGTAAGQPHQVPALDSPGPAGWRLLPGLPLAALGLALNLLPLSLAALITRKKVWKQEFFASVLMATGMVLYLVYWLLLSALAILAAGWPGVAISLAIPLSGYLALRWYDRYRLWRMVHQHSSFYPVKAQRLQQPVR